MRQNGTMPQLNERISAQSPQVAYHTSKQRVIHHPSACSGLNILLNRECRNSISFQRSTCSWSWKPSSMVWKWRATQRKQPYNLQYCPVAFQIRCRHFTGVEDGGELRHLSKKWRTGKCVATRHTCWRQKPLKCSKLSSIRDWLRQTLLHQVFVEYLLKGNPYFPNASDVQPLSTMSDLWGDPLVLSA